jgi:hypothetical protein
MLHHRQGQIKKSMHTWQRLVMPDEPLDMLVIRDMPDGSFAVADALKDARVVQDGFKSRAEAEKFIEGYYLARGIIAPQLKFYA